MATTQSINLPRTHTAQTASGLLGLLMQFDSRPMLLLSFVLGVGSILWIGIIEESLLATLTIALLAWSIGSALLLLESVSWGQGMTLRVSFHALKQFWSAFGWRIFFMTMLHLTLLNLWGHPNLLEFGGDEVRFFVAAGQLADGWQTGHITDVRAALAHHPAFTWMDLLGVIRFLGMSLDGDTAFNLKLISCLAGALMIPYVAAFAIYFIGARAARIAAALTFWMPEYWLFSSTLMRDVMISCLIVVVFYQVVELIYGQFRWWRVILTIVLNFVVLNHIRSEMAFIILFIVLVIGVASWLLTPSRRPLGIISSRTMQRMTIIIGATLIVGMAMLLFIPQASSTLLNLPSRVEERMAPFIATNVDAAQSGSIGAIVLQLPYFLRAPLGAIVVLLLPTPPWLLLEQLGTTPEGIMGLLSGIIWFPLLTMLPVGLFDMFRNRPHRTIWVWGVAMGFLLILGTYGAFLLRWRLMVMPFLLMIIAQGICTRTRYTSLWLLSSILVLSLIPIYLMIKLFT